MKIMKLFYVELLENIDVDHLYTNNMSLLQMITSINTSNVGIDDERRELDNYIIKENDTINLIYICHIIFISYYLYSTKNK